MKTLVSISLVLLLGIWALSGCSTVNHEHEVLRDKVYTDSLVKANKENIRINPYEAIEVFSEARKNITDSISSYTLLDNIALCYYYSGNIDSVFAVHEKCIQYCEREESTDVHFLKLQETIYNRHASFLGVIGDYKSSVVYYKKASEVSYSMEDRSELPGINYGLAGCYEHFGDYAQAGYHYRRALLVADSLNVGDKYKFNIFLALANIYTKIDDFQQAEYYFQQAEQCWDKSIAFAKYVYSQERGCYYRDIVNDYQKALEWLRKAEQILKTSYPQLEYRVISEYNLGDLFLQMEQLDSARYHLGRAKEFYEQSFEQPDTKFIIDGLLASLAMRENRLHEAEKLLLLPYDSALIDLKYIYEKNLLLTKLYVIKNDFKKAYEYRIKADANNDSLRSVKVRNNIAEIDMRYRQDTTLLRKDLRIAVVEGRASRWQQIALISMLVLVVLTAAIGILILYNRRKREKEYRRQMAVITGLRMEIVRNRISPHFMFNALNAMMPALEQYKELEQHFDLLITMLRGNLSASEQIATYLQDEIALVKNYLQLQMLGHPDTIQIDWSVAGDVSMNTSIPSMIIQIPVENAVKYAFEYDEADARISISINRQTDAIQIIIDDNGAGYRHEAGMTSKKGTGNGLKMLYRTVELLNTRNSNKMSFSIVNKKSIDKNAKGTSVTISVPLDYRFEIG